MKPILAAAALSLAATATLADPIVKPAQGSVAEVMDRLEGAVTNAGATVFARVNHGAGATSVDMELADAELLIFGNPMLGTPVMQQDIRAGLVLPLHVLVHNDGGSTVITYDSVEDMMAGLDVDTSAEVFARIAGALDNLTNAAAGN